LDQENIASKGFESFGGNLLDGINSGFELVADVLLERLRGQADSLDSIHHVGGTTRLFASHRAEETTRRGLEAGHRQGTDGSFSKPLANIPDRSLGLGTLGHYRLTTATQLRALGSDSVVDKRLRQSRLPKGSVLGHSRCRSGPRGRRLNSTSGVDDLNKAQELMRGIRPGSEKPRLGGCVASDSKTGKRRCRRPLVRARDDGVF
jgi:hypothetical protein